LRIIGTVVLIAGLAGAYLFYWRAMRSSAPTIDELMPGYSQKQARQNAILMGNFTVMLLGWADSLKDPGTQAMLIAGASVVTAIICFKIASLMVIGSADS
jgi:hypothetical protein